MKDLHQAVVLNEVPALRSAGDEAKDLHKAVVLSGAPALRSAGDEAKDLHVLLLIGLFRRPIKEIHDARLERIFRTHHDQPIVHDELLQHF